MTTCRNFYTGENGRVGDSNTWTATRGQPSVGSGRAPCERKIRARICLKDGASMINVR